MLIKKIIVGFLGICVLSSCSSTRINSRQKCECDAPVFDKETAINLLDAWGHGAVKYRAFATNVDPYKVAGQFTMTYYTPEATLLPTVSPVQREGTQEIYDYFVGFLSNNPEMNIAYPEHMMAYQLGCGFGSAAGYYDFKLTNHATNQTSIAHARFTFVYEYKSEPFETFFEVESGIDKGKIIKQTNPAGWYIDQQQSSLLPVDVHKH